ncbi:glycerol-3-phosphate dehydrogenase/oxidase [Brevibacillus composti]|uniref:Glycerol-3-phosphate dehydrogenase n=1 Tax=Brevibacillus composti TaxID=2796470 RepID=A0A7T5ENS7_9BACL|nr:glycerol-3-phosphate dehydrogenase/oxidase [Brevibacillus composti]QQE75982.1 glycerol-3-phosphate dehydrogenase/oxidase [Brevibacillus composti]QUO43008.1 glycerol-3-phosphate dehydrogenase/oxidase [Brevibacillus composti]
MGNPFSARTRQNDLQEMEKETLDLLVIGGGITGAGIALDASKRGIRVGLVEKNDFGSGTSSRSTKLIHGGLRYLKQGEVKLVREVGRERAILYQNAPHLVIPAPMLLPIYQGGSYGYWATSIGLFIYDVLAGVARRERRNMLGKEETLAHEPLLKGEGLKGGGLYVEYRTDDARLTLDILKTAAGLGAKAVNYAEAGSFLYEDGRLKGIMVTDRLSGKQYALKAKHVVNAAGPWVDRVRQMDGSLEGKRLYLTKGVHLVVSAERLPVRQSAYFDTPDGRMVFVIPRGKITYIGTTDTSYRHSIDEPRTTAADRDYLLRAVNSMFPTVHLRTEDVLSHWAGLRPLIYEEGKGASELSRKDEIFHSSTGLITIAGGKLTGFRKMAEKVVNLVARKLQAEEGKRYPGCSTDAIVISGGERHGYDNYAEWKREMHRLGTDLGVDADTAWEWIDTYGTNTLRIYERIDRISASGNADSLLAAQIRYAIEEERTVRALDFLRLRTGWTYFQVEKAEAEKERVIRLMAEELGWSAEEAARQREEAERYLHALKHLPPTDEEVPR